MALPEDHPLRYQLANELHARPFPSIDPPSCAAFLAIKQPSDAAARDREADRAHLIDLLDRFGASHPNPGATHWFGEIGRHRLKWESHTEIVTYTVFVDGVADDPFDPKIFDIFPKEWLKAAPGVRITSALIRVEPRGSDDDIAGKVDKWFVSESVAISRVLDDSAVIAGDFRIDPAGHMRFGVFASADAGPRRLGRIVQRISEIEVYKTLSMLGFARARSLGREMSEADAEVTSIMAAMRDETGRAEVMLDRILKASGQLETLVTTSSFRFGATKAYSALVDQRIAVLRETRFEGRQTFQEFMMRRFNPAMRTVGAVEGQLKAMSDRSMRAGELLRTRVEVERSAQNQRLLASMDQRADMALRLQRTVEGLSVVAVSYYAVNLVLYLLAPAVEGIGMTKPWLAALATPVVVLFVWMLIRKIRHKLPD